MSSFRDLLKTSDFLRRSIQSIRAGKSAFCKSWCGYVENADVGKKNAFALRGRFTCDMRSNGSKRLLLILAGYKRDLWHPVFSRVRAFIPKDIDVCMITSGKVVDELRELCGQYGWTYLATERNNLCLAQNIAIDQHKSAELIYKIDEDVFLTKGFFERLEEAYVLAPRKFSMDVGFVAPLLPVNGYGCVRLIKRLGLVNEWERRFGTLVHVEGTHRHPWFINDPDVALFLWGKWNDELRGIDRLNERMSHLDVDEALTICPSRFSIGAILFSREVWAEMGMFPVAPDGSGLGLDEHALCVHCMLRVRAMVVAENSVVGHLAFGPQTKSMLEFFHAHPELFEYKEL